MAYHGEGLASVSKAEIVISPSDNSTRISTLEPFARQTLRDTCSEPAKLDNTTKGQSRILRLRPDSPFSTADDADDEGSIHVASPQLSDKQNLTGARDLVRSRPKQLRRRGIDLSRDGPRISSRWSSGERRSKEKFREAIKAKVKRNEEDQTSYRKRYALRGRPFVSEAKMIGKKVTKGLRESLSRPRRVQDAHRAQYLPFREEQAAYDASHFDSAKEAPCVSVGAVQSSSSLSKESTVFSDTSDGAPAPLTHPIVRTVPRTDSRGSWQHHLHHDLRSITNHQPRRRKAKYLLQEELEERNEVERRNQGRKVLPSDYFAEYHPQLEARQGSAARSLLQASYSMPALSDRDVEQYWRLPSLPSPRYEDLRASMRRISSPTHLQCLDEIIGSGELQGDIENGNSSNLSTMCASTAEAEGVERSPTSDPLTTIKAQMANARDQYETVSARPLMQPSNSLSGIEVVNTAAPHRNQARLSSTGTASGRLTSWISLSDGLDLTGRYVNYYQDHDGSSADETAGEMKRLSLHPLNVRLPHENLTRPSAGNAKLGVPVHEIAC